MPAAGVVPQSEGMTAGRASRGRVLGDLELVADRDAQANPHSVDHGDFVALRATERALERERRFALM